jgi:hypothetical protein
MAKSVMASFVASSFAMFAAETGTGIRSVAAHQGPRSRPSQPATARDHPRQAAARNLDVLEAVFMFSQRDVT